MTDEEILKEYHSEIEAGIQKYANRVSVKMSYGAEEFAKKYKEDFIKGFREGYESTSAVRTIATKMLKKNSDPKFVASVTGLSIDDILKLQSQF